MEQNFSVPFVISIIFLYRVLVFEKTNRSHKCDGQDNTSDILHRLWKPVSSCYKCISQLLAGSDYVKTDSVHSLSLSNNFFHR